MFHGVSNVVDPPKLSVTISLSFDIYLQPLTVTRCETAQWQTWGMRLDGCIRYNVPWCIMHWGHVSLCAIFAAASKAPEVCGQMQLCQHSQHSTMTDDHCAVRYLEPVIAVLSRIWSEMDSMREHRLLRFKLLRLQNMQRIVLMVNILRNSPMIMNWFHDRDLI